MVCRIRLSTRCATSMAAGMPLRGLLHGRRDALPPVLFPPRRHPRVPCPWTSIDPTATSPCTVISYLEAARSPPCITRRFSPITSDTCHHLPLPLPICTSSTALLPVDTGLGTHWRRWEKGSSPQKTHPPSPSTCSLPHLHAPLPTLPRYRMRSRSSIPWLLL
jgi:hypothetical protein